MALAAGACGLCFLLYEARLDAQAKAVAASSAKTSAAGWRQWGGPNRNFIVEASGLAEKWPDGGPRTLWTRALGTGHSAVLVDEGKLYTMYRPGAGKGRAGGPWEAKEFVVAMDAKTGATLWEHSYPSPIEDFSYGAGPHSTPLIVGDRLFTVGTNKLLNAFDKVTGKILWSHDFVKDFNAPPLLIRPVVKVGYGCSLIAYRDTIICSVGGPGQSVMAFRQSDGGVVWKSGDFLTSDAPPVMINFAGRDQLVFLAGGSVQGLDPATDSSGWSVSLPQPCGGNGPIKADSGRYRAEPADPRPRSVRPGHRSGDRVRPADPGSVQEPDDRRAQVAGPERPYPCTDPQGPRRGPGSVAGRQGAAGSLCGLASTTWPQEAITTSRGAPRGSTPRCPFGCHRTWVKSSASTAMSLVRPHLLSSPSLRGPGRHPANSGRHYMPGPGQWSGQLARTMGRLTR